MRKTKFPYLIDTNVHKIAQEETSSKCPSLLLRTWKEKLPCSPISVKFCVENISLMPHTFHGQVLLGNLNL